MPVPLLTSGSSTDLLAREPIAFQAGAPLVRDAHLYIGHIQGGTYTLNLINQLYQILIFCIHFNNTLIFTQTKIKKT